MYAYVYHEFVRNFMGNQCGCPFEPKVDTLRYRLAYSFSIGDLMTLVVTPTGELMTHWGTRDFAHAPDMDKTLTLIRNLTAFYRDCAKPYLYAGRMCRARAWSCEERTIALAGSFGEIRLPSLLIAAYQATDGGVAHIVVNPKEQPQSLILDGQEYVIPGLDAKLIVLPRN
jgi:hypothetical protein